MPRRNRNKLEIMMDIMEACREGSRKTRIMYTANLSYELTKKYISEMEKMGLIIKREEDGEMFFLTERGRNLLDKLRKYRSLREEYMRLNDDLRRNLNKS
ncbi:hypothetical protein HS1genome_0578 [Sulfodiicoccus acidiphilus]|uniref:ArnR1-like winged helix-turn-helix domain-containing protein n=1 Tax=Sulfodiicoccus acidiphilus TaxID=1670455 RepID=A0A348B1Y7_9CREN|nr:winged helix-turn-helix domain-containing protein [Sulfodiicoccus acidiphilus]BBD72189.1 hypothetical protein HS1genome_0578 [Sulfodiicoccus acidiphilus]GGT94345.1 hypothetical protein GCM10007116_09920 [Sulfodiicoccus acidiphilus]